jgi:hypothetical protein
MRDTFTSEKLLQQKMQSAENWCDFYKFAGCDSPKDKDGCTSPDYNGVQDLQIFVLECYLYHLDLIESGETIIKDLPFILQDKTGHKKVQIYRCNICGNLNLLIDKSYPSRLRYCPACKEDHNKESAKVRKAKERARKKGKILKFCQRIGCGKLLPNKSPITRKYCSDACRVAALREREDPPNCIRNPDGSITRLYPVPVDPDIIEYISEKCVESNKRQEEQKKKGKGTVKYGLLFPSS